jgi:precorrin-2/cobalt-factor-2 C20-methyltransferase
VYSTFSAVARAVIRRLPRVEVVTVPGITAFQDLASRSATVLLEGRERLRLVTGLGGTEALEAALDEPDDAVVVYKGGRHLPELAKLLAAHGRLEGAMFGELLGLPGERVTPVADAGGRPASYLATVLVPPLGRTQETSPPRGSEVGR